MNRLRHPSRSLRWPFVGVLLIAAMLRLMTPAGFMPAVEAGRIVIALCPGASGSAHTAAIVVPMHKHSTHGSHHHDKPAGDQSCPFAAAAGNFTLGEVPHFAITVLAHLAAPHREGEPLERPPPLRFGWPPQHGPPFRS